MYIYLVVNIIFFCFSLAMQASIWEVELWQRRLRAIMTK